MEFLPYLVIGVIILFAWMQLRVVFSARAQQGKPAPYLDDLTDDTQRNERRLIFYFFSEYCGPCKSMTPVIERLSTTHNNIIKVDVARDREVARRFGVAATPTMVVVEDGRIEKVMLGTVKEERLSALASRGPTA